MVDTMGSRPVIPPRLPLGCPGFGVHSTSPDCLIWTTGVVSGRQSCFRFRYAGRIPFMSELVSYAAADGIATIAMDDGKVNVLSLEMLAAINKAFDQAESDG